MLTNTEPMLALKFKAITFKKLLPFKIVLLVSMITTLFLGWIAVPVGFLMYVIVSLLFNKKEKTL